MDLRVGARQLALRMWLEKPVVGWGIGEYGLLNVNFNYPHNTALEILAEMGLVGGSLFLLMCVPAVRDSARILGSRASGWPETAIALLFLSELPLQLTVTGYLAADRIFFAWMGLAIGSGAALARGDRLGVRFAPAPPSSRPQGGRPRRSGAWVRQ
jgi:O-antigen ligase